MIAPNIVKNDHELKLEEDMNWDRINVWTNTFYTLLHSLHIAHTAQFGNIDGIHETIISAGTWITPECSYKSPLLDEPFGRDTITFRRDPNKNFEEISKQLVKMLIQDLTVIFDQMMEESIAGNGFPELNYPQSKIEKLATILDKNKFNWAKNGCLELVAVRNVLTHAGGKWNEKSIEIVRGFVEPLPKVGEPLVVGVPMLFRYRKAIRTFLNETKPTPSKRAG